ncbi:MAG TPA: AAA family ATPase [Chitinophagaceae bacterium]|nr:AAA family ATPase [Chitinophagaceae bacterium]
MAKKIINAESLLTSDQLIKLAALVDERIRTIKQASKKGSILVPDLILLNGIPQDQVQASVQFICKLLDQKVMKVDLEKLISNYIGETEKNLSLLLKKANKNNAILFFDEADALFGKRTDVKDAHDKYANQEVSYLLQRLEAFTGIIIMATVKKVKPLSKIKKRFQTIL